MPQTAQTLQAALDHAPIGLVLLDRLGSIEWANATYRGWCDAVPAGGTDVRPDPLIGGTAVAAEIERAVARGVSPGVLWASDTVALPAARGGAPRFVDATLSGLPASPEVAPRLILVLLDASARVREHELARLHYEAFLTSTNAIEVTDRDGVLIDVNPAFVATYGYSRAECLGKRPNLVRSRKSDPGLYERMWADLLAAGRGHWSGELVNRDRWGREIPVFLTITAVKDEAGATVAYVGVAVNLTEQKTWEQLAAHSDRLASLGQLAAGVAHEINTPLANVMLVAESLRRRSSDPWTRERAESIIGQVDVAARIVRGLLDFARRNEPQVARIDLGQVARESVRFLRGKQPSVVEVEERLPSEPLAILGDRSQLMQVVTNLLLNAYDALEGSAEPRIVVEVRASEGMGEVEVRDSGPGIPLEALPHIFEPFFTTKPEGRGTGLGLAICHGIVQAHGGTISARNMPGGGASLLVRLPLATPRPSAEPDGRSAG